MSLAMMRLQLLLVLRYQLGLFDAIRVSPSIFALTLD